MHLVFLHGPPAAGKYTIAGELAALTGFELYHNHLAVDAVLKEHAFGSPGFVAGRDRLWREHLTDAARRQPPGLIFTFNPENSVPPAFLDWLFTTLPGRGVTLHSVGLTLPEAEIERRLGRESRHQFGKLTDLALYRCLRAGGAFDSPAIPRTDLEIDTDKIGPTLASQRIAAFVSSR